MNNLWIFSPKKGKERDLITLYIFHSLDREPKSGYDLLKEMSDKTGGAWVPSKGTVYPLLKSLEKEGLIRVAEVGKRSKNIFGLTESGEKTLKIIRSQRLESRERLCLFKNLLMEIFGAEMFSLQGLLMEIQFAAEEIPAEKRLMAMAILEESLEKLKAIGPAD
ncbi:MAG: PadR family transcriptional regulator [Methanomicrobiaceae archaeon]|nr:PadR family transcriptional regulator [Methanomicrobiaceae archaeon]